MRGIVASLRDLVPIRPLTQVESYGIAELQANKLVALSNIDAPPVPEHIISDLPRFQVERVVLGDTAGATQWSHGRWLILLNSREPATRQRFSLAHEFKHVLDNPFVDILYPTESGMSAAERRERICDHFAACLLMPRPWVKHLYCDLRVQDATRLAHRFAVSPQAMRYRLNLLGLTESSLRYPTIRRKPNGEEKHYERLSSHV